MKRASWWTVTAAAGAVVAMCATTMPAQAAATSWTRLDCYVAGVPKRAAMEVNMSQVSSEYWKITSTKYNTVDPAFHAEKVWLMLQIDGSGDFHTINTWGDGSTNSVATSGTSNPANWSTKPPNLHYGVDKLKLKISEGGSYMDCKTRPVGWHN